VKSLKNEKAQDFLDLSALVDYILVHEREDFEVQAENENIESVSGKDRHLFRYMEQLRNAGEYDNKELIFDKIAQFSVGHIYSCAYRLSIQE